MPVTSGTRPERRACWCRSVGTRPGSTPVPGGRWPAPSNSMTSGIRSRSANSAMRYRLAVLPGPMEPPSTVKSSAPIITGRPPMVPDPVTIPSAGATSPGGPTRVPISRNESSSSRWSIRARASSRPPPSLSRCRARRSSPPMALAAVRRPWRSSSRGSQASGSVVTSPVSPRSVTGREVGGQELPARLAPGPGGQSLVGGAGPPDEFRRTTTQRLGPLGERLGP